MSNPAVYRGGLEEARAKASWLAQILWLAAAAACGEEPLPAVSTFQHGGWAVHVEADPFRLALHRNGQPLLAERARRAGGSIEALSEGRWWSVGAVERFVAVQGGRRVVTKLGTIDLASFGETSASWSVELPGAKAVGEELILQPGEVFFLAGGSPSLALSSRGYGLLVRGAAQEGGASARVTARQPDPDTLRLEAEGESLDCEVHLGAPRELAAIWRLAQDVKGARRTARSLEVRSAASLAEAVHGALAAALAGELPATLRIDAGIDPALRQRALQAAVLLNCGLAGAELDPGWAAVRAAIDSAWRPAPLFLVAPEAREAWTAAGSWMLGADVFVLLPSLGETRERVSFVPTGRWLDAAADDSPAIAGGKSLPVPARPGQPTILLREEARERAAALARALDRFK